jgi:hypothetical protein
VRRLLVTASFVLNSPIIVTLMMAAIRSSEKSILTKAARLHIADVGILRTECYSFHLCGTTSVLWLEPDQKAAEGHVTDKNKTIRKPLQIPESCALRLRNYRVTLFSPSDSRSHLQYSLQ